MKKTKQLTLFPNQTKKFFGGALLYKKRKSKRPLSKKDSIHLVLRSEWAMGCNSFLAKRNHQQKTVRSIKTHQASGQPSKMQRAFGSLGHFQEK